MMTGREMYPSCSSRTESINSNRKSWIKLEDKAPTDGETVITLIPFDLPKGEWHTTIATYCDGLFYKLEYDPHLGVLRKMPVNDKVLAYAKYLTPDWEDEF